MSTTTTRPTMAKTIMRDTIPRTETMNDLQKEDERLGPYERLVSDGNPSSDGLELISIGNSDMEEEERRLVKNEKHEPSMKEEELSRKLRVYLSKREMSPYQERWNAITMIPSPLYCWYYIAVGNWLTFASSSDLINESEDITGMCWGGSYWLPPAMPPLPLIAIAIAITIHAPFSMVYHWKYAPRLTAKERVAHWSRRMDQCFIHIASALCSFGTSGSLNYFLVNILFNIECCYRLMLPTVRPGRNQIRILISIIAYTIPILRRGDFEIFAKCWAVLGFGGWLFATYPLKGWSHAAFHIVLCLLPPLLMEAAAGLPSCQHQVQVAYQCSELSMQ